MKELLFFDFIPKETIWGNNEISNYFNYNHMPSNTGQIWVFSEENRCLNDTYKGMTINQMWKDYPTIFASKDKRFPVIISLVAPSDDLSVQIHPTKEYAIKLGYPYGKNEAWYFIKEPIDKKIIYGKKINDKKQLLEIIEQNKWESLLNYRNVTKDDFIYIPAGQIHALLKGSIVYEIQQNLDVTYRFYDYNRVDNDGKTRPLHIKDAINSIDYTLENCLKVSPKITESNNNRKTIYISNDSFEVTKLEILKKAIFCDTIYQLVTVIEGEGFINDRKIIKGNNFIIPANMNCEIEGNLILMMTTKRNLK